ncbi:MAG: DMT family transporter [Chloroflexota bacterium]
MDSERVSSRVRADLTLLLVAVIWGSAFVVQRLAALQVGVLLFNGLRFLLGALVLLPFAWRGAPSAPKKRKMNALGVLLAGALLVGGAGFQQAGLQYTTAGNAGFITGLYVVLIPIFLTLGWRERPRAAIWVAALLAVCGLFLLSTGGSLRLNPGDILELAGAVFWALHVILVGRMVQRMHVMRLAAGQYLACGVLSALAGLAFEPVSFAALADGWWAIAYTGILSVGLGYTLQAVGQRVAPPADAAILLSMEAVFAALFGWLFLTELLTASQLLGCGLMFGGVLLAQLYLISGVKN